MNAIDITPIPDGFRGMKAVSLESIQHYEKTIRDITRVRLRLAPGVRQLGVRRPITTEQLELLHTGLDLLESQIEASLDVLRDTVRELERCGY